MHKKIFLEFSLFWSHLNAFEYVDFFRSESDFERFLRRLLKDSRKTLGRLIENSSNIFYARILPTKSSWSLPKSSAQSGTKEWCQVESKPIYVEVWYLAPCVIVLFMICFIICMCTILVLNFFVNLKKMLIKRIW